MKTITFPDDKNTHYAFKNGKALGWVHCFSLTDWSAYDADGNFIDWFVSKKSALAAIA